MTPIAEYDLTRKARELSSGADKYFAYRPDIEGLRAIAVTAVVGYHYGFGLHSGFVGVDIFFVISGYLISGLLFAELNKSGHIALVRIPRDREQQIHVMVNTDSTAT